MRFFSRLPISLRLTILAMAALCPLAIIIIVSHLDDRESRREAGVATATSTVQTWASLLDSFAGDLDSFMQGAGFVIGGSPLAINNENTGSYLKSLQNKYPNITALFVTDLDGRVIAQADGKDTGLDLSGRPYMQALKGGKQSVWSGGLTGLRTGEIVAAFGRVIPNQDGTPRAYIVAAFQPSLVTADALKSYPGDANLIIVDQKGQLIADARKPDLSDLQRDASGNSQVQQAVSGKLAQFRDQDLSFESGKRYGAVAPIPNMGWAIGYTRSQSVLDASIRNKLIRDLTVLAAVMLATAGALIIFARQISRPLVLLSSAADDVAAGRQTSIPRINADPDLQRLQRAFSSMVDAVSEREEQLREQARVMSTLEEVGAWIASDLDFKKMVQAVTDAGTRLTEAQYGAFFYNTVDEKGESYVLHTASGAGSEAFAEFPMPRNTAVFAPTFTGDAPVRVDDITKDARYSQNSPYSGMPPGRPPVHSYLAVPVKSGTSEVIGGLFFGHEKVGVFTERHEKLATGIAAWSGIALENATLYSESQKAQEELRRANRAKDEFLGLVSHELRTPTTTIYGGMRMLETRRLQLSEEMSAELITSMAEESGRLVRLIENLLAFARLEMGREIERQPVSVNASVRQVVESFLRSHHDHQIDPAYEDGLPPITVEPTYFEQVVQNLLSNADKYSPAGNPIEVTTRLAGNEVQIVVSDHGPGVAADETELIFESFYRSDKTSDLATGHGLGLTVCKRLVEAQNGRVWAKNRPEGGLEVGIAFPVVE